jgi:hypothetical protein
MPHSILALLLSLVPSAAIALAAGAGADVGAGAEPPQRSDASVLTAATALRAPLRLEPATIDLGELTPGRPKSATLTVTNLSDAPVTVDAVVASCGCTTVAGGPTRPVPPGDSFTVRVTLDPGLRSGAAISRAITIRLSDGSVATTRVRGVVLPVVCISPDVVDATLPIDGATAIVRFERVDGYPFRIIDIEPRGVVAIPAEEATEHALAVDLAAWHRAGRPAKLTVHTDAPHAETLVVPIRAAKAVAMFRLPAPVDGLERQAAERAQDAIIHAVDARLAERGPDFVLRLHRESGMVFVHGSDDDVAAARRAFPSLPPDAGVREGAK